MIGMIGFLIRRVGVGMLTLWVAFTLSFVALRALPGDAISTVLVRSGATAAEIASRRSVLGLDQPLGAQYITTISSVLRGDWGTSLISNRPVSQIIAEQSAPTVELAAGALVIATLFGIGAALIAVFGRYGWLRMGASFVIALLMASPVYWVGTLLIYGVGVGLRLPTAGADGLPSLILPWLAVGLTTAGSIARTAIGTLRDYYTADFARTARAKGLRPAQVNRGHILRAGCAPLIVVIGLQAGFLLGGAVITESLFVRPGLGKVLINAINDRDYPVVQGVVLLSAAVYSAITLLTDSLSAALDPRLRIGS